MQILSRFLVTALSIAPLAAQIPPDVPAQYQAIYGTLTTQISAFQTAVDQGWNGKHYPVNWAPHLSTAESSQYLALLAPNYYTDTVLPELLELQATGANAVTLHVSFPILYQPFYTFENNAGNYDLFLAFYQQVVSDVHARGMKVVIEATVAENLAGTDSGDFQPYYQSLTWTEFMSGRAQNDLNIAQLLKPDYLSVICEPDSEAYNGVQPTEDTPAGALQLLQTILTAFQTAGETSVPLGAGTGTWEKEYTAYVQEFAATPLTYIDIHVYPLNQNLFMNVLTAATIIHTAGKQMGVSESWAEKVSGSELGVLDVNTEDSRDVFSFWAPIDTAFLKAMVDCAQYQQMAFYSASFPGYFAEYLDYNLVGSETPQELLSAAFPAWTNGNRAGTFTSTGVAFSTFLVGKDKTPPATPAAPTGTPGFAGVALSWTPTTDNVGVAGYDIYRNGVLVTTQSTSPFYDQGLSSGVTYTYYLTAYDAQGNMSGASPTLTVTTLDQTPPTVPTGLQVTGETSKSVSLSWSPSTGGGGVGGYRVLRGASPTSLRYLAGNVQGTTYTDNLVWPTGTFYYAVESYNTTGYNSALSSVVKATTPK